MERIHKEKATARPIEEQVPFEPMAPRPSDRFPAPCHGLHTHPGTENNATSNTQAATIDISLCLSRARRDREFVATCDHSLRSPCIRVTSTATKNLYISYYPTVINANADATKSNAKNKKKNNKQGSLGSPYRLGAMIIQITRSSRSDSVRFVFTIAGSGNDRRVINMASDDRDRVKVPSNQNPQSAQNINDKCRGNKLL